MRTKIKPLDMPQGEAQEKCPPCPRCGKKAWIVDGYEDKFWLLCILCDDGQTVELPDHLEIEHGS